MKTARVILIVGRIFIGAAVLLLLFTAFQFWGTGLLEGRSQHSLKSQFQSEVPRHARVDLARLPPVTAPYTPDPPEGQPVGELVIPSIHVDQIVVEGVQPADLRLGPGHYPGTSLPGQRGNSAIAGHRTTYGHPFYNLDAVRVGQDVTVTTKQGIFEYQVLWLRVVSPSDVQVIAQTPEAMLTLTTCNPRYSASQRLILRAKLAHSYLFGKAGPAKPEKTKVKSNSLAGAGNGDWVPVVLWSLLVAGIGVATWWLARRYRRRRWVIYVGGIVAVVVPLFYLFVSISPFLPATF